MTATEQLNTFVNFIQHDGGVCVEKQNEYLKYANVLYKGYLLYIEVDKCGRYVDVWFKKIVGINDVVVFKFKKKFYSFNEFKVYIEFKLPTRTIPAMNRRNYYNKKQNVLLTEDAKKIRQIIWRNGGYREEEGLKGDYYIRLEMNTDEHKVYELIDAKQDKDGHHRSFSVDVKTGEIVE